MTIREALETILKQDSSKGYMTYAQTYAKAALEMGESESGSIETFENEKGDSVIRMNPDITGKTMIGEELRVQLLYVLSNLDGWKGEEARNVKAVLKKAT